jgi:hypothetical protein
MPLKLQSRIIAGRVPLRWVTTALVVVLALQSCGSLPRRDAVPHELTETDTPLGVPDARFWMDGDLSPMIKDVVREGDRERSELTATGKLTDQLPPAYLLALSGGSDGGAFGAGLPVGWSGQGTRPEFKLVTGISAGALIAPFAFLGPKYDDVLHSVSTSVGPKDFFRKRGMLPGILSDGIADSAPLARLIAKYVTPEVLAAVAREYEKGRFLLIGTTDLDAGRAVMWNMGAIATSNSPGAIDLFRKVMLASSSIPGVISPVMIDVDIDRKPFQEMHVDGGAITQVFLYPRQMFAATRAATGMPFARERHAYLIRNGQLESQWAKTKRRTLNIGDRAISTLIQTQGVNDLDRIYLTAQQDGVDFNLAFIGPDFAYPHKEAFATDYMRRLYDYAYQLSVKGYPWSKSMPRHSP